MSTGDHDGHVGMTTKSLPDDTTLIALLTDVLNGAHQQRCPIEIISRTESLQGTFRKEVVECRIDTKRTIKIFCKYGGTGRDGLPQRWEYRAESGARRWGGVEYEGIVYEDILSQLPISVPQLHGVGPLAGSRDCALFLEFIPQSVRVSKSCKSTDPSRPLGLAARWIGRFHRLTESLGSDPASRCLLQYDRKHVCSVIDNASGVLDLMEPRSHSEIADVLDALPSVLEGESRTVVHGEYYPKNVLLRDGVAFPVDWETAGIGPGILDLASITGGWPSAIRDHCARVYSKARWPDGGKVEPARLASAALYWRLLWMGERTKPLSDKASRELAALVREARA